MLVATSERLFAVDAASGVCVPAGSSGVCSVGLAVTGESVDEGIGVLACAFRFLLRMDVSINENVQECFVGLHCLGAKHP